jgi:hypothetical protein
VRRNYLVFVLQAAVALAVVLAFLVPAARLLGTTGAAGAYPIPLDDVYIYFDFARSTARGCFLCWTEGNGLSTGATSPPYALVLALGWAVGFRGQALGALASLVAVLSLFDLFRSVERLAPRPTFLSFVGPLCLVGVPLLDWSLASGMETAFAAAVLGRALVAAQGTWTTSPAARARAQLRAGLWLWLLAWARPELTPLGLGLAVAIGHGAGTVPLLPSLARALGPLAIGGAGWALVSRGLTGEAAAAGAVRKLVTTDPYASSLDKAGVWLRNLLRVSTEGIEMAFGGSSAALAICALVLASLFDRRTRRLGASLGLGAAAALGLICLNTTAPFQNLRYVAPILTCLLVGAILGVAALSRISRAAGLGGALALAFVVASAARAFPRQVDNFARSSRNIAEQQVEVGRRLRELGARRVFVGDAGAIPYVSELAALDGLGLGGYRDYPFARASVHGLPAVIELIEHMQPDDRPDVLAIYDSWWPGLGERFGRRLFSVKIDDNVICGADEKVVYRADWRLLEDRPVIPADVLDRVDIGDLIDERRHEVTFTQPKGGFVIDAVHPIPKHHLVWDAGRVLAAGQELSFSAVLDAPRARATLLIRSDEVAQGFVEHQGRRAELPRLGASEYWTELEVTLDDVKPGDRVRIVAGPTGLRLFAIALRE